MQESFNFSSKAIDTSQANRGLLSAVSSIFDSTALLASFILKIKLLIDSVWRLKIGRDNKLPTELADCWGKCLKNENGLIK